VHIKIYTQEEHAINERDIDPNALEVIHHLKRSGYEAFLVGGSVRDLLLKKRPKDFDISTSARPEEIKHLFGRRCLLIGKRFRLAHIRFGAKVLELSTFRSGDVENDALIVRDNSWGTAEDDVMRRDFTMNALFYDPANRSVLDYVGGYHDIQQKIIRTIGEPATRFRQDPVRMIRALKFQARFGFHFDHKTQKALEMCKEEITKSAPARVLEEMFKMLESAHSREFFKLLRNYDFLEILFPCFHHFFLGPSEEKAFGYLGAIDQFHTQHEQKLDRALLMTSLVFPILEQELITLSADRQTPISFHEILHLSRSLLQGIDTSSFAHFPKKLMAICHAILSLQYRLTPIGGAPKFHGRFTRSFEFQLALDFLRLRCIFHPELEELYSSWKKAKSH
jgi:poly(A) polymerase